VLTDVFAYLRCPACGGDVHPAAGTLRCAQGHSYDIARQGYVNLLGGGAGAGTADTAPMVAARGVFLAAGYFAPVLDALARAVEAALREDVPGCVVEVGAGTGYYLAGVLDRLGERTGVALDLSKYAARRAARAHARIGAVVADTWSGMPLRSGVAAVVLDVFAPRNAAEFSRVLAPAGSLVVVTPTARHLQELVDVLGLLSVDPAKESRTAESLSGAFDPVGAEIVEQEMSLSQAEVTELVSMGPSSRHLSAGDLAARVADLPEPVHVTLSVTVATYRPKDAGRATGCRPGAAS
jgi:23S rRNA (guanine745-N1)-methyltransferase